MSSSWPGGQSTELDVVVRTTAASIFGYFVSAGAQERERTGGGTAQNRIGFSLPEEDRSPRMEGRVPSGGARRGTRAVPSRRTGRAAGWAGRW